MQIKVLFDKLSVDKRFLTGWGFSVLVDNCILFDTGEKPSLLLKNMESMGVDISSVRAVVISHDHWDHTGGLWEILSSREGLKVYGCPGFSAGFKDKVGKLKGKHIELDKVTEIVKGIYSTGEIPGEYKGQDMPEQALVVRSDNGISVITGCAHPGVVKILRKVKEAFSNEDIYLVFGGFHMIDADKRMINIIVDEFKKMGVKKAGPCHCSGNEAEEIFRDKYKDDFVQVKAGKVIQI